MRRLWLLGLFTLGTGALLAACGGDGSNNIDNPSPSQNLFDDVVSGGGGSTTFTVAGAPQKIEVQDDGAVPADGVRMVMDGAGNVTVVWIQKDASNYYSLYANRYSVGSGWGTAVPLELAAGDVQTPQLVVDNAGNVTVLWAQSNGSSFDLYAKRYAGSWGGNDLLEVDVNTVGGTTMVVDPASGDVTVIWSQYDGVSVYDMYANRYTGSWGGRVAIEGDAGNSGTPKAVISGGVVTAYWLQENGGVAVLWANRYNAGWGAAASIDSADSGSAFVPDAVVDSGGNVTMVWIKDNGVARKKLLANYHNGAAWSGSSQIDDFADGTLGTVTLAEMVVDSSNNVTVVWSQDNGSGSYDIWANRYAAGWGGPAKIETGAGSAGSIRLVVDGTDNVTAGWVQNDGTNYSVMANRYSAGWGTETAIESQTGGDAQVPILLVDGTGVVTAIWLQEVNGLLNLMANRYSAGWGTEVTLNPDLDAASIQSPSAIVHANNNVTVMWRQRDSFFYHLLTRNYVSGVGWDSSYKTIEASGQKEGTGVLMLGDSSSNTVTVWRQPSSISGYDLWGNRF